MARILGDGTRRRTQAFTHLQSHYLFRDRFGRPGKGNDKGKVEALVKTARRRFMVPIPKVHDLSVLNERLLARCLERLDALEAGGQAAALLADLDALRDLPAVPFEACEHVPGQISSTAHYRPAMVKGYAARSSPAIGAPDPAGRPGPIFSHPGRGLVAREYEEIAGIDAIAGTEFQRLGIAAHHPQGRVRLLHRHHRKLGAIGVKALALVVERLRAVCRAHVIDEFHGRILALLKIDPERGEEFGVDARHQAKLHAPAEHLVGDGDLLDQPQRMIERDDHAHRPDAQTLGALGRGNRKQVRRRHPAFFRTEMMLDAEPVIESQRVAELELTPKLLVALMRRHAVLAPDMGEMRELHGDPFCGSCSRETASDGNAVVACLPRPGISGGRSVSSGPTPPARRPASRVRSTT